MKRVSIVLLIVVITTALILNDVLARGGRGGGGGGGGGGSRGGGGGGGGAPRSSPAVNRSPSMSRPSTPNVSRPNSSAPSRPATAPGGNRPSTSQAARPSQSQVNNFLDVGGQGAAGRPGAAPGSRPSSSNAAVADFLQGGNTAGGNRAGQLDNRTATGSGVRDNRGEGVAARGEQRSARVADRDDLRTSLADGSGERRTARQEQLGENADRVRDEMKNHYDDSHLFDDFWSDHPHAHYQFNQNPVFWTWATWNTAAAFMPWNWGTPAYYDYGSGGNVYYEEDTVHTGDTTVPADEYAQQAEEIATTVPEVANPDEMEWLPLGVFALTKDGDADAVPNMFLQLAVSKEGIIAGTYQNKSTGQTESVEGMVDQKSQRAAWTIVGKNTPIVETGIANLTQNETGALLHFADGQTQQWLMVRVEGPQQ